jgi:hypothetical protein
MNRDRRFRVLLPALLALLAHVPLCALAVAVGGCGGSAAAQRAASLAEGRAHLAEDPSAALHVATTALHEHGADARLELLAAEACLKLKRLSDALAHAERGLAAEESLTAELAADLSWAQGKALMGRYREVASEEDWRAANAALERATDAGSHRAEAAFLLVALQDLGPHRDDERQLRFARVLQEVEPDGQLARDARALLEQKGLSP